MIVVVVQFVVPVEDFLKCSGQIVVVVVVVVVAAAAAAEVAAVVVAASGQVEIAGMESR